MLGLEKLGFARLGTLTDASEYAFPDAWDMHISDSDREMKGLGWFLFV